MCAKAGFSGLNDDFMLFRYVARNDDRKITPWTTNFDLHIR